MCNITILKWIRSILFRVLYGVNRLKVCLLSWLFCAYRHCRPKNTWSFSSEENCINMRSLTGKNRTRPIYSHLDRTSLVNKVIIIWVKTQNVINFPCRTKHICWAGRALLSGSVHTLSIDFMQISSDKCVFFRLPHCWKLRDLVNI